MRRSLPFLLLLLLVAAPAEATRFTDCAPLPAGYGLSDRDGSECTRVKVPLDRSGAVAGTVPLYVSKIDPRGRRPRGALFIFQGGPGGSSSVLRDIYDAEFGRARGARSLVAFDLRGTGRSRLVRCPSVERKRLPSARDVRRCAEREGTRREFFTTRETVEDIEAVRKALGVRKVALYGVSFGTKVAQAYADAHPDRVERQILDSVVPVAGSDPFYGSSFRAIPKVLRGLCTVPSCPAPVSSVVKLVQGPLPEGVTKVGLFNVLLSGDFEPLLRRMFPGAAAAAARGDAAPMVRLQRASAAIEGGSEPQSVFSTGLYYTTTCEESPLPWDRDTPFAARPALAAAAAAAIAPAGLAPFDQATALASDVIRDCTMWAALSPPQPAYTPARVPTLALAGGTDLRTPVEDAAAAAAVTGGKLITVPNAGHAVVGQAGADCARRAARRFLLRKAPGGCSKGPRRLPALPTPPLKLTEVEPVAGIRGRAGRTLAAVRDTLTDAGAAVALANDVRPDSFFQRGNGLRGGRFEAVEETALLENYEYLAGLRVSGRVELGTRPRGRVKVSGRAGSNGVLRFSGGGVRGRLGGRAVRVRRLARVASPSVAAARSFAPR